MLIKKEKEIAGRIVLNLFVRKGFSSSMGV